MRSCWSGEVDQLVGVVDVTVVVRWVPGLTIRCGTRVARLVRNGGYLDAVTADARRQGAELPEATLACVTVWRHWAARLAVRAHGDTGKATSDP
jgi:hypothetical protein